MINVDNISFSYSHKHPILHDISFTAQKGEIINILGPNGCGKTTLLKIILGFFPVDSGSVYVNEKKILELSSRERSRTLAYVPQLHSGVFNYSVLDVVLMGRSIQGPWYGYTNKDKEEALSCLRRVRMEHTASRSYLQLSGGERQLVLIARALAQGAKYIIMDEPVTGLDYGNQFRLLESIQELTSEGLLIILTTHHPEHAVFLGGRAILMKEGRLLQEGVVEEVINKKAMKSLYAMDEALLQKIHTICGGYHGVA